MEFSLIVATYNRPDALELSLLSIYHQKIKPHEIIIADDGSDSRTKSLIKKHQSLTSIPIIHVWQEDKGFRVSRIRNLALAHAQYPYIVSIDGDLILHPYFLASHVKHAQAGYFIQGKRVLLSPQLTQKVLANQKRSFSFWDKGIKNRLNSIHNMSLSKLLSSEIHHANGIKGCNISFWLADAIAVNGFNEAFEGWGREDSEFVVRMLNRGIKRKNLVFCAVAYHLDHHEDNKRVSFESQSIGNNDSILQQAIEHNITFCSKGIDHHLSKKMNPS